MPLLKETYKSLLRIYMADLEESLLAKRNKTEEATSDELGDESDDPSGGQKCRCGQKCRFFVGGYSAYISSNICQKDGITVKKMSKCVFILIIMSILV